MVAIVAACIAATIAYRQWKTAQLAAETARNKLKLDLFEKRYAVYSAAARVASMMTIDKKHDVEDLWEMMGKLQGIEFLYSELISDMIHREVIGSALTIIDLQKKRQEAEAANALEEVKAYSETLEEHRQWFVGRHADIRKLMSPYLQLSH